MCGVLSVCKDCAEELAQAQRYWTCLIGLSRVLFCDAYYLSDFVTFNLLMFKMLNRWIMEANITQIIYSLRPTKIVHYSFFVRPTKIVHLPYLE